MNARRLHNRNGPERSANGKGLWCPPDPLNRYLDVLLMSREGASGLYDPIARNLEDVREGGESVQATDAYGCGEHAFQPAAAAVPRAPAAPCPYDLLASIWRFQSRACVKRNDLPDLRQHLNDAMEIGQPTC